MKSPFYRIAGIICFLLLCAAAHAQTPKPDVVVGNGLTWDEFVDQFTTLLYDDADNAEAQGERLELLHSIHDNPINVNAATRDELLQLPFLSPAQADSIVSYVSRYGPMLSLGELMLIRHLDYQTRQFLTVFLTCAAAPGSTPTLNRMLFSGKNEVNINTSTPFYTPDGYRTESPLADKNKYLGDKNRFALRFRHNFNDELQYGVTTEKDAGEPFACRGNALTDSYSAYFYRRQRNGRYTFALGDYKIRFAEGLIVGNGYFYGKKGALYDSYNNRRTISAHTSASEYGFFRGAAGAMRFGRFTATAFASRNECDAILNADGEITSFLQTGYHRTQVEQQRRNNTKNIAAGADLSADIGRWNAGFASVVTHYSRTLNPRKADYNRYAMRGKDFHALSAHYNYNGKRLMLRGEAAISEKSATALVNTVRWKLMPYVTLTSIQRSYSMKYATPFAESFKTSGKITNEQGVFTGITAEPTNSLLLRGYVDIYRFPWPTYSYRAPMNGADYSAEVYLHNYDDDHVALEWRGSSRKCEEGFAAADTVPANRNLLKLTAKLTAGNFTFYSNLSGTVVSKRKETSRGWMFNQRVAYKLRHAQLAGGLSYFNTDNYAARIYAYENNVPYMYNLFSPMYGNGVRFFALAKLKIIRRLNLALKYAGTKYFDRDTTGSGAQKVHSSYVSDLTLSAGILF